MNSHVALECTASECCFVNISLLPLFARDTISEQKIARDNLKNTVHVTSVQSCNLHHPIHHHPPTPSDDPFVLEDEIGRSECQVKHTVRVLLQRRRRPSFCSALANTILG